MTGPDEKQNAPENELDLEPETVVDLDVDEENADAVRGGPGTSGHVTCALH